MTAFNALRKTRKNLGSDDKQQLTNVVVKMLDEYITTQMYWTKRHAQFDPSRYLNMLGKMVDQTPNSYMFIEDIQDAFDVLLSSAVKLPTWRIIYLRARGAHVQLEMGEDYRVQDWMEKHAKEYRASLESESW